MENLAKEILEHLINEERPDVQLKSLEILLGMNEHIFCQAPKLLTVTGDIFLQKNHSLIVQTAGSVLINMSANEKACDILINEESHNFINGCLENIINPQSLNSSTCCVILSNLTRFPENVHKVLTIIEKSCLELKTLIDILTKVNYNNKQKMDHLSSFLANLSQSSTFRLYLFEHKELITRIFPLMDFKDSLIKRRSAVALLKNCCMDTSCHHWLFSESVDFLPYILLPLAGNEEFNDEENASLHIQLQYLPEDKKREENPQIRQLLLEMLLQLCAFKQNRMYMRNNNVYVILRELHKWEKDASVLQACQDVVEILIRDEDDINCDNLKELVIPSDISLSELERKDMYRIIN